ncbi:MAG: hypothetical protein LBG97_00655 [Coriobacteriales bacterium]|jgi:hypothetical protein|nr:hypothetical protein [Coriobacteriales bacterium]
MRIITKTVATLLVATILLISTGCTQAQLNEAKEQYNPDYKIGVIKTTTAERSSYIEYYDEDLNLVNVIWYPYAQLETNRNNVPAQRNDTLCLVPRGLIGRESDRKVITINLKNGEVREYPIDLVSIKDTAIDDRYIYAQNNLNNVGTVARVDISTGETATINIGTVPGFLLVHGENLYVHWIDLGNPGLYASDDDTFNLSRLNKNLDILSTFCLADVGASGVSGVSMIYDEKIYITMYFSTENGEPSPENIYSYSLVNDTLEFVSKCEHKPSDIAVYNNELITVNRVELISGFIDIYDRTDGTLLNTVLLDYSPDQMIIDGDNLYIQGFECLVKYHISGSTITELKRVDIPRIGSPADTSFHYLAGMFKKG